MTLLLLLLFTTTIILIVFDPQILIRVFLFALIKTLHDQAATGTRTESNSKVKLAETALANQVDAKHFN